ncbi:MAG: hypothetical protein AVDCRST_MAG88-2331, partial [uncultured Thermomicrobiales bacterium]
DRLFSLLWESHRTGARRLLAPGGWPLGRETGRDSSRPVVAPSRL